MADPRSSPRYFLPATVEEAVSALATGAVPLAGGTDFYPALRDRPVERPVADLGRIAELRGIRREPGGWRFGAMATWSEVIAAGLPPAFDGLVAAAREVGSVQIQNTGTIAGNLCNASPAADGVPPLLALDASVEIAGPAGRRVIPLGAFITGPRQTTLEPGELVTAVTVPDPGEARGSFVKLGARRYLVISIAMVAAVLRTGNGRIAEAQVAVGSCSAVAARLASLEAELVGLPLASAAAAVEARHLARLSPIDDVRGTAEYRELAALELIRRALALALPQEVAA